MKTIGVLGAGRMGSGIAQVCAMAGHDTVIWEPTSALVEQGMARIQRELDRLVTREGISGEERTRVAARISTRSDLSELEDRDLIIEAVIEDRDVKTELFRRLDEACGAHTVLASNTSSLSITDLAAATQRPTRVIGLHFFNPAPVMKLVEVVRTISTDGEVLEDAVSFVRGLGREPIRCDDRPGFVVNRLLVPLMMDAIRTLESGVARTAEIDLALKLGAGHPMGPLALCDFVGNDTLVRIGEILFTEYRERRFSPPPLLRRMVALGYLGRKAGRGFYDYSMDPPAPMDLGIGPSPR